MLTGTEKKRIILSTAQGLFNEKGYAGTSVRDIAKSLDMEAASLYSHIKSKEDFLKVTCFELADQFELLIAEVNDIYFNAEEKLRMAIQLHVELLCKNLDASAVFLKEWRNLSGDSYQSFIAKRHRYEDGIRAIVQNGIDEGIFNETDKKFASLTILSSVNWIVEWYNPEGKLKPSEVAFKLSNFILEGLKSDSII